MHRKSGSNLQMLNNYKQTCTIRGWEGSKAAGRAGSSTCEVNCFEVASYACAKFVK